MMCLQRSVTVIIQFHEYTSFYYQISRIPNQNVKQSLILTFLPYLKAVHV